MARKRYSDEDCLKLLREIEVQLASGSDVPSACRAVGISHATYYSRHMDTPTVFPWEETK